MSCGEPISKSSKTVNGKSCSRRGQEATGYSGMLKKDKLRFLNSSYFIKAQCQKPKQFLLLGIIHRVYVEQIIHCICDCYFL